MDSVYIVEQLSRGSVHVAKAKRETWHTKKEPWHQFTPFTEITLLGYSLMAK